MSRQSRRFTIYDMMEEKGIFEANPANVFALGPDRSSIYRGPVAYPKMLYHPQGAERILVKGTIDIQGGIQTRQPDQMEIIHQLVNSKKEEDELRGLGWHDHPADAIAASGKAPPPTSSDSRVDELKAKIKEMEEEIAKSKARESQSAGVAVLEKVKGTAAKHGFA